MKTCPGCGRAFVIPRKKPWQTYCRLACMIEHGPWSYRSNKPHTSQSHTPCTCSVCTDAPSVQYDAAGRATG